MTDKNPSHILQQRRRARAARSNASGRFETYSRVNFDDGWHQEDEALSPIRTEYRYDESRTIIAKNRSPDLSFDQSINPYRGCEHGCIYCFARPSHAYLGLSPGLDFETRILVKPDAAELLRKALTARKYVPKTIAIGTNTDPYQPAEKSLKIMRGLLKVLAEFQHPVGIVTKGALIRRDVDLLENLARNGLTKVGVSLTTLDPKLCRALEPRASAPSQRLKTIETLANAGVPVRAMIAPLIPGLTDHELERLLQSAKDAGATLASKIMIRLPLEVEALFQSWLQEHHPMRAARVMNRIRDIHGGRSYDPTFGHRMRGSGVLADLTSKRFDLACRKLGLRTGDFSLRTDLFNVPGRASQLQLF